MSDALYTVSQFAEKIGVHVKTLQKWDREGTFKAQRTPTNRRYYTDEDYENYRKGVRSDVAVQKNQDRDQ